MALPTPSPAFRTEMAKQQGTTPRTKVEFIDKAGNVTDVTAYWDKGANFEQVRQRAVSEIQAGQFDVVMENHDDTFSEYKVGSMLYGLDYHGAKIRLSQGFLLPSGTIEYQPQCTLFIDQLVTDKDISQVTFRCRDVLGKLMDQKLHAHPSAEVAVAGTNVGTGTLTGIAKLAFTTVNETFTVTCTLAGADGVATFSVVGTVAGSIGPATSGTEFVSTAHGVRFKLQAGAVVWSLADSFTFAIKQNPEWTAKNAGKIIWAILTGYDWDANTVLAFSPLVFGLDPTQSDSNVDIDYNAFATAIAIIDAIGVFAVTGFIPYDSDAITVIQNLMVMFLGSIYSGNDGRVKLTTYIPDFTPTFVAYGDTQKVMDLSYSRGIDEVINQVTVNYLASKTWPWSNSTVTLDGAYVAIDSASITARGAYAQSFSVPWYSASGQHVQDFAAKLIARYKDPPLDVEFTTGMDALLTQMGDRIVLNDTKAGFSGTVGEVTRLVKQFDAQPSSIMVRIRKDATTNTIFGTIGSTANEGDGVSPQSDSYDTATTADKQFAYFSKSGSAVAPQYSMF